MRVRFTQQCSTNRGIFAAGDEAALDGDDLLSVLFNGFAKPIGPSDFYDDLMFPAQAVNPVGVTDAPSWDEDHCGWRFVHTVNNVIQIVVQIPHRVREQSTIYPHLHLKTVGTSSAKTVTWEVKWRRALPNSGVYSDWVTESDVVWDVPADAGASRICALPSIDMRGYTLSSMIDFQITRKTGGGTDLGAAIIWKQFDCHVLVDSAGSASQYNK